MAKIIAYSVSDKVYDRMRKIANKSGVSMAGISRLIVEDSIGMYSDIDSRGPQVRRERVISDVTIKIAKGIKVRIV